MKIRQEAEALDGRVLRRIGVGVVLATLFGVALALLLIRGPHGTARSPLRALGEERALRGTPPRAQETAQYRRLAHTAASADPRLRSYAWVDRDAGVVRIPVERAFELMSAEAARRAAAPAPPGAAATASATSALPARGAP